MLLAVDPGKGAADSIGWATFSEDGSLKLYGQDTLAEFVQRLESLKTVVNHVVMEEYVIYAKRVKQHTGSKVETIQTIGMIKYWAMTNNIPWSEQKASILQAAQNMFQIYIPADHRESHKVSALLHGLYYLWVKGIIKSELEKKVTSSLKAG